MNRESLFRAKKAVIGEWVEGYYFKTEISGKDAHYILRYGKWADNVFGAVPETVGQYIGLKDRNEKKIFEGDIVKIPSFIPSIMVIGFIEGAFCLVDKNGDFVADIHYIHHAGVNDSEVIGNIYDNPEMIGSVEGGNNDDSK